MKRPALSLAFLLFAGSGALILYRILWMNYPIFPTAPGQTWQLSITADVRGGEKGIQLALGLPTEEKGRMVMEERSTSRSLTFFLMREGLNRIGAWSGAEGREREEVTYQALLVMRPRRTSAQPPAELGKEEEGIPQEETALAERLARRWNHLPAADRVRAIAATVQGEWMAPPPQEEDLKAWIALREKQGRQASLLLLFRAAQIPARTVIGLKLVEGIRNEPLIWIEAWNGQGWVILWPRTGDIEEDGAAFLSLAKGGIQAARVSGGELLEVRWELSRQIISHWRLHFERIRRSLRFLDQWSLFHLPPEFQETFRILLLVPIGTLMISLLRNFVGFPTFGIFMPVLMALAFRNTGLTYGVAIFGGVLLIGYAVRRWLERLHLLLVSRMSVILTLVIACFTLLALIGQKLTLREFMAVGLLPFVILTMVIERFFVIMEEAGAAKGLRTAGGSLAVSVLAYELIRWESLQLTFFVFPELLASVAAGHILLGRYTGYRLSELFRFRVFREAR